MHVDQPEHFTDHQCKNTGVSSANNTFSPMTVEVEKGRACKSVF